MNAGLLHLSACGSKPLPAASPTVAQSSPSAGVHVVTVSWTRSGDDASGEKDIERYAIFRRPAAAAQMNEALGSVPAAAAGSYSYTDLGAQAGVSYVYGVAAQDCTPAVSDIVVTSPITISNP
jgi:hypothetical protein